VAGIKEAFPDVQITNRSVGGSPGMQFACAMDEDFSQYSYVFFDSVPNDEIYEGFLGERDYQDRVIYELCSTIASQTNLIVVGFCLDVNLNASSRIYEMRRRIAAACGAQFVGMRELVLRHGRSIIGGDEELYETDAHPRQPIQRAFGQQIGHALKNNVVPHQETKVQTFSDNFWSFDPATIEGMGRLSRRKNSLFDVTFLQLGAGEVLDLSTVARGGQCLGFYLDKFDTRAIVFLEGVSGRRAKEYWYDLSPDAFEMRFIPIENGYPLVKIVVAGEELPFERSAYSGFAQWPNADRPARLSISKLAFWKGDRSNPLPLLDDCSHSEVLHSWIDDVFRRKEERRIEQRAAVPLIGLQTRQVHGSVMAGELSDSPLVQKDYSRPEWDRIAPTIKKAREYLKSEDVLSAATLLDQIDTNSAGPVFLRYVLGHFYYLKGNLPEAERQLVAGMILHPAHVPIRQLLANLYTKQNRAEEALVQLGAIAELTQDAADFQKLGTACLRAKYPDLACAAFQAAIKLDGSTTVRCALLGTALLRMNRYEEAVSAFEAALAGEPNRLDALRECAKAHLRLHRPEAALPHLWRIRNLEPLVVRSYVDLGRTLNAVGRSPEAEKVFEEGLQACGDDIDLLLELARHRARAGDRIVAMDLFARALAIQPDHLTAALEYIRQAMTARKFGPAKEVADKLIAQHPEHPEVLFEFGRVCLETAQPERARESFEAALRHRPEMHQAHYRLSQISLRANDIPAAVEQMSRAVDLDPTRVSYRIDRARMYLALGQFDAARADAGAALAIEPRNLKANQIVSLVREMSDERPEARVAACFHATAAELSALQAALTMLPAPHEAWIVVSEGAAPEAGERVLRLGRDAVEPTLTEASEAPWMLVAPAAAAPAIVALLADPSTEAALRPLEKIYGRAVFIDAAGLPAMTVMRRELLHFFGDMAEIEGRPAHALLAEHEEMLRTVTIDPAGVVHRLPAPTLPREDGREKVFLISRHGYQLYGGGEQFLRGMATIYRGEGFEPVIIGMRSDTPAAVEGEEEGQRFAQLRPLPGDIFTYALKHRPRLVQVLSGLGYEVITPLKYLHVATVYGTHFWRDMFEEIGGYLNIDQTAVPKREFNAILQQATVVYSNSHYTAEMKRKHFGVSTPLVYSLTADTDAPPVTTGKYALLVNARPEKGFDLILEVAKRVPHVPFLVLASQSPVAQAQEAVERAGVKNITIAGKVSDMMEAYSRAKVVLVPSYAFIETFSRVVIEAHRLGVPVIGSDRGNVPYLMTESGTSLPEDADAWAAELDRLFTDRAYYDQRVKLALENSERYAFARQPERIRRIVGFTERRILVAVGAGLGNIVQTSPLIRRLAEHYGRPVDVVVKEDFKGCSVLVAGSPYVNMVFPLDRNVVQREYDMVYVTHSFGDIIPAFNSNTIVAARRHFVFQMTKDIHEAEFNLFCARELLGVPYEKADAAKYFVANASRSRLPNGIIGIHSGGKGGEWEAGSWLNKRWPYYKDLVKALQARGYKVASFGVQSEYVEGTIDLTGTPLIESVRNIAQCSYFIGNDSGLMHIADGLGVPLTTIFGPTSVVKNGPLAPTSSVIELKKDCAPCQFDERFATCTCIASVGLEPVLDHVLRHMAKAAGPEGEKAYKELETLPVLVG
jgi:tetratricopeptide (TPR) repeat protein/ADP-heptose:LPS heptosyltransferase/glycosyltransferase involved in cell wall biosynthesis